MKVGPRGGEEERESGPGGRGGTEPGWGRGCAAVVAWG